MEHLHPEDAFEQLQNIYSALAPGGVYICVTPNRIFGPHDISKYFDDVATGFHLKEYTIAELVHILRMVGFSRIQRLVRSDEILLSLPIFPVNLIESLLCKLLRSLCRIRLALLLARFLLGGFNIKLVATK